MATLNELVQKSQGAAKLSRAEGKKEGVSEGKAKGRREVEQEMAERIKQAFDDSYAKAKDDVVDQLMAAEAKMKAEQHSASYVLGYNRCLDDEGVGAEDGRMSLIEVPSLADAEPTTEGQDDEAANASNEQAPLENPQPSSSATPSLEE